MQDKYSTALVEELGKRFPDLPIIKAFQVFDPQLLPSSDSEKAATYGNELISELSHHYHLDTCTV